MDVHQKVGKDEHTFLHQDTLQHMISHQVQPKAF